MTRKPAWSDAENARLIALYFEMLDYAIPGKQYSKAGMIREVRGDDAQPGPLLRRSKQSIEFKLMNASAAHAALDPHADTMDTFGYRAMPNYQAALKDEMLLALQNRVLIAERYNPVTGAY